MCYSNSKEFQKFHKPTESKLVVRGWVTLINSLKDLVALAG